MQVAKRPAIKTIASMLASYLLLASLLIADDSCMQTILCRIYKDYVALPPSCLIAGIMWNSLLAGTRKEISF